MTRYILWRQSLPPIKINRPDSSKLLTPLKILKEAQCSALEVSRIDVQRTFPIDSRELQAWYYETQKDLYLKHRNWDCIRYCLTQIYAAYSAAKIGNEITTVTIWTEEGMQE